MKKGLNLEEAFKALNGRLSVNGGSKKAVKGKRKVKEDFKVTEFDFAGDVEGIIEDLRQELPVYTRGKTDIEITPIKDFYGDNDHKSGIQLRNGDFILITDTEQGGLIYKVCRNKTEMLAGIRSKKLKEDKIKIPSPYNKYFEIDNEYKPDEESGEYLVGDTIENYDMKLLAYLKTKDNAPEYLQDVFPFLVDDSRFPVIEVVGGRAYPVELDVFEKDNLRKYTAAVREIKNDPTKKIVLDYGELQDPRFLSITFENGKLVIDDEEEKYDLDPKVMKDWMNFDSIKVF